MNKITWLERAQSGRVAIKRRTFKSLEAQEKFIQKLFKKENFLEVIAYH